MQTNDFTRFHGRLRLQGRLTLVTPLRIGAGGHDDISAADITVVRDALGRPYIPGSSFKGVLRSHVERILRTIDPALACLTVTTQEDHACPTTMSEARRKARLEELDGDEDRMYLEDTCRVCQVFGSTGLAAKIIIPDLTLDASELNDAGQWYGRTQVRHGVSIDRDTETAAAGRLFTGEAVPAGTVFACEIVVENGSAADQGLVLLGLRAFEQGQAALGGATSRGLGQVRLALTTCEEVADDANALIDYLIDGTAAAVDEAGRLAKIQALRADLEAKDA